MAMNATGEVDARSSGDDADLARAFDYPYERPQGSFLYVPGGELEVWDQGGQGLDDRRPVLAIGSNAAPFQLGRKFSDQDESIPVVSAKLRDHDVVYGARLSLYGAVPASLCRSPGTAVQVHVMFLTRAQLEIVDRSEGVGEEPPRYRSARIHPKFVDCGFQLDQASQVYVAARGNLSVDGSQVALKAFPASGRNLPAMSQREVLGSVSVMFDVDVETLVRRAVDDETFRTHVLKVLASQAVATGELGDPADKSSVS